MLSIFPVLAKYLKCIENDDTTSELEYNLVPMLLSIWEYTFKSKEEDKRFECFLGDGLSLWDCSLVPTLFYMGASVWEHKGTDLLVENTLMNLIENKK